MSRIEAGEKIGYAIVVESDDMDVFGNPKPNSYPMVMESNLNNSLHHTKDRIKKYFSFKKHGQVVICELVVKEVLTEESTTNSNIDFEQDY